MKVIQPSVKKVWFDDVFKHIEYCTRVCTNTQDKADKNSRKFVEKLIGMEHLSCLEHAAVDVSDQMVPLDLIKEDEPCFGLVMSRAVLGSLRYRDLYECSSIGKDLDKWQTLPRSHGLVTLEIQCSRITSQQFERHRNFSYLERSMRYVTFDSIDNFEVVLPDAYREDEKVLHQIETSFDLYKQLRNGMSADEARYVLPMCTATKFCVSGDLTWWLEFLRLRYNKAASKEMIKVASLVFKELPSEIYFYVGNTPELEEQFEAADELIKGS